MPFSWLSWRIRVPEMLHVNDTGYLLDGGTTEIYGRDDSGRSHLIVLTQHQIPRESWLSEPIGRLYFDRRKVPMRSAAETSILRLLEQSVRELERNDDGVVVNTAGAGQPDRTPIVGNPDIAAVMKPQTENQRMGMLISWVIEYVRSDQYGKLK